MPKLNDTSIVIPVSPIENNWEQLLSQLVAYQIKSEVIFSCASDEKVRLVRRAVEQRSLDFKIIQASVGRAAQMNAGAAVASKTWLWFLHADSEINQKMFVAIEMCNLENALGYFDLRFSDDGPHWMSINSFGAWFRSRFLKLPFGDQGFVLQKDLFNRCGQYREDIEVGEDHALVWTLRRAGASIKPVGANIGTSARKYKNAGWLRTTRNHLLATWQQARRFSSEKYQ